MSANNPEEFLDKIKGESNSINEVKNLIRQYAPSDSSVAIFGESGTGKELVARAIHNLSSRRESGFFSVNCASIPETLVESLMFGIKKGVATDVQERQGWFSLVDNGTLFLDEIGELTLPAQANLLRVLQEKKFRPVGGEKEEESQFRLITATNRDLNQAVKVGIFREDLFYRITVLPINLPSLRKRIDDIPILIDHFLNIILNEMSQKSAQYRSRKITKPEISEKAEKKLLDYAYPGNIRELENVIRRAYALSSGQRIEDKHITFQANSQQFVDETPAFEMAKQLFQNYILTGHTRISLKEWRHFIEPNYASERHKNKQNNHTSDTVLGYLIALSEHYFGNNYQKTNDLIHYFFQMESNAWRGFKCRITKVINVTLDGRELPEVKILNLSDSSKLNLSFPEKVGSSINEELLGKKDLTNSDLTTAAFTIENSIKTKYPNINSLGVTRTQSSLAFQWEKLKTIASSYVSREKQESLVENEINSNKKLIIIRGEPGIGKSMLLAHFAQKYSAMECDTGNCFCFFHFAYENNSFADILESFVSQIISKMGQPEIFLKYSENYQEQFSYILCKASASTKKKLLFVLDAFEEVSDSRSVELRFLPAQIPSNVIFLISTRPGMAFQALKANFGRLVNEVSFVALEQEFTKDEISALASKVGILLSDVEVEKIYKRKSAYPIIVSSLLKELAIDRNVDLDKIPTSLEAVFDDYFRRLENLKNDEFRKVLALLCAFQEQPTRSEISKILGISEDRLQHFVLNDLAQYLRVYENHFEFYHALFRDYVRNVVLYEDDIVRAHKDLIKWCVMPGNRRSNYSKAWLVQHHVKIDDTPGLLELIRNSNEIDCYEIAYQLSVLFQSVKADDLESFQPFIFLQTMIDISNDDKSIEVIFDIIRRINLYVGEDWARNFAREIKNRWNNNPIAMYGIHLLGLSLWSTKEKEINLKRIITLCGDETKYSITKFRAMEDLGCTIADIELIRRAIELLESSTNRFPDFERLLASVYNDLAIHYARRNQLDEAEKSYLIAQEWEHQMKSSIDSRPVVYSLGFFYILTKGLPLKGLPLIYEAADQRLGVQAIGKALFAMRYIAYTYANIGFNKRALKFINYIIAFRRRSQHRDVTATIPDLRCRIRALMNLGKLEEANEDLNKAFICFSTFKSASKSAYSDSQEDWLNIHTLLVKENQMSTQEIKEQIGKYVDCLVSRNLDIKPFWETCNYIKIMSSRDNFSEAKTWLDNCWSWLKNKGSRIVIPMVCDTAADYFEKNGEGSEAKKYRDLAREERHKWKIAECAEIYRQYHFDPMEDENGILIDPNDFDDCEEDFEAINFSLQNQL